MGVEPKTAALTNGEGERQKYRKRPTLEERQHPLSKVSPWRPGDRVCPSQATKVLRRAPKVPMEESEPRSTLDAKLKTLPAPDPHPG